jgi:hypothetical protein
MWMPLSCAMNLAAQAKAGAAGEGVEDNRLQAI